MTRIDKRRLGAALLLLPCASALLRAQDCAHGLDARTFRRVMNRQFSALVNAGNASTPGTYGAYNFKDGTIDFSGSLVLASGSVLTAQVSGSGDGGVLPVIDDQKVNDTFAGELRWQHMSGVRRQLTYTLESCRAYHAAIEEAKARRDRRRAGPTPLEQAVRARIDAERVQLAAQLRTTADSLDGISVASGSAPDAVRRARAKELRLRADSVQAVITALAAPAARSSADRVAANNEYADAIAKAEQLVEVVGTRVHWFTVGLGFQNNSFRQFIASKAFDNQVTRAHYVSTAARAELTFLDSPGTGTQPVRMLTIGAQGGRGDTFDNLSPITLTEVTQYGSTPGQRSSTRTIKAMVGDYATGIWRGRAYVDTYRFFRANSTLGIHAMPEVLLHEASRGRANVMLGLVAAARNSKGDGSRINVEPYILLRDVAHRGSTLNSLLSESQFGFRFTLPITFQPPE